MARALSPACRRQGPYPGLVTDLDRLAPEKYISLTTYRRDGRAVATPVWMVRDGDALTVWTAADSGKVKRLRRNTQVTVAPCDARGRTHGAAVPGRAQLLDAAGTEEVKALLKRKYGLLGRLSLLGSKLRRGSAGTVGVRIELTGADEQPAD